MADRSSDSWSSARGAAPWRSRRRTRRRRGWSPPMAGSAERSALCRSSGPRATRSRIGRCRRPAARGCSPRRSTSRCSTAPSISPSIRPRTCRRACRRASSSRATCRARMCATPSSAIGASLADLPPAPSSAPPPCAGRRRCAGCGRICRSRCCAAMSRRASRKLERGEVDATLLAMAGPAPARPGRSRRRRFSTPDDFLPAVGQGAIAIAIRAEDARGARGACRDRSIRDTGMALAAERAFLTVLDGSCRTPIAGHARLVGREPRNPRPRAASRRFGEPRGGPPRVARRCGGARTEAGLELRAACRPISWRRDARRDTCARRPMRS